MARCEDCIHEKICVIKAFPDAFENTAWDKSLETTSNIPPMSHRGARLNIGNSNASTLV